MYIDLTQRVEEHMPVYPGTPSPIIRKVNTFEKNGFVEHEMSLCSHIGTHMDAPAHMIEGGRTLDTYPMEHFLGKAYLIDIEKKEPTVKELRQKETELKSCKFVIFRTNWSKYWGKEKYFEGFPVPSLEVVKYLLEIGIKGFGIDTLSIDTSNTTTFENHKEILGKERTITENLMNLAHIQSSSFEIAMIPLKIKDSDGCWVRAFAKIEKPS